MKRILTFLLVFLMLGSCALADPLTLLDDYTADITEPNDPDDPSAGTFVFRYHYPHADEQTDIGSTVNAYYEFELNDMLNGQIPMLKDSFYGTDFSVETGYEITCNSDDYFSVLIRSCRKWEDHVRTSWKSHVFSRKPGEQGNICTLPVVLGILDANEKEEWIQTYQTEKVETAVRELVWEIIEENGDGYDYGELTEDYLEAIFFPAEDFYLDEDGEPVFFLKPDDLFDDPPADAGLITFSISAEDIMDEL